MSPITNTRQAAPTVVGSTDRAALVPIGHGLDRRAKFLNQFTAMKAGDFPPKGPQMTVDGDTRELMDGLQFERAAAARTKQVIEKRAAASAEPAYRRVVGLVPQR